MQLPDKPFNQWTTSDFVSIAKTVDKATWIKIGAGAAVALVFGYFIVWPAWFQRVHVDSQVKAIESQIIRVETLKRKRPEWVKNKEDYLKFISDVKGRLFAPEQASLLLGVISRIADETGVSIISSRPRDDVTEFPKPFNDRYVAARYDFTVEGGYHDLGLFVSRIESYSKNLRVDIFHVTPRESSEEDGTVESLIATMTLSAVSLIEDGGGAKV